MCQAEVVAGPVALEGTPASPSGGGPSALPGSGTASRVEVQQLSIVVARHGVALKAIGSDAKAALVETRAIRATLALDLSKTEDVVEAAEKLMESNNALVAAVRGIKAIPGDSSAADIRPSPPRPSPNPGTPKIPDAPWAARLRVSCCCCLRPTATPAEGSAAVIYQVRLARHLATAEGSPVRRCCMRH